MRTFVAAPRAEGRIRASSSIPTSSSSRVRCCARRAARRLRFRGRGARDLPPDRAAGDGDSFDDDGRTRGMEDAARTPVAHFDADCRARCSTTWRATRQSPRPAWRGGLLHRRAPRLPRRASARCSGDGCFYGTGIHNGKLGKDDDAGSLASAPARSGASCDGLRHARPARARRGARRSTPALDGAGTISRSRMYPAEHAFMRDEGPRYDPEATDPAFAEMVAHYRRVFETENRSR